MYFGDSNWFGHVVNFGHVNKLCQNLLAHKMNRFHTQYDHQISKWNVCSLWYPNLDPWPNMCNRSTRSRETQPSIWRYKGRCYLKEKDIHFRNLYANHHRVHTSVLSPLNSFGVLISPLAGCRQLDALSTIPSKWFYVFLLFGNSWQSLKKRHLAFLRDPAQLDLFSDVEANRRRKHEKRWGNWKARKRHD